MLSLISVRIADHMTAIRKKYESSVIDHIGDELLSWVRIHVCICEVMNSWWILLKEIFVS